MAVPNPERELARLDKALSGGLPPVLLVQGPSDFFRQEAIDKVLAAVDPDLDLRRLDGDKDGDGRELDGLRGGNLFGRGTVICVRRGDGWLKSQGEALLATTPKINKGSSLILEIKKLDKRTKLAKALVKAAELFEFRDLYTEPYDRSRSPLDAEMVGWLVKRSRDLGCPLRPDAAFLVMSSVGTKPAELLAELQRIADAVAADGARRGSGPLGPDDLRGTLTCSFESTPFEFADALLDGDRRRATRTLTAMYARGAQGRDGARIDHGGIFPFISSWLYQSLAQLHEGRLLMDSGVPIRDVPSRLGVRVFVDRFLGHLAKNDEPRLRRGLKLLHQAQRDLRGTAEDPEYLLLRFLGGFFAAPDSSREGAA